MSDMLGVILSSFIQLHIPFCHIFWKLSLCSCSQIMRWYHLFSQWDLSISRSFFHCITRERHSIGRPVMPQSHPTTGPVRFLSPVRFLARKAEWSTRRIFTSVLFPWSHQATGPVRLDTSANLWFGWIIRRTPRVPRAMPVRELTGPARESYGPRRGIFNVFYIPRNPYGARAWSARVPYGALTGTSWNWRITKKIHERMDSVCRSRI